MGAIIERLLLRHSFVAACVVSLWISTRLSLGHSLGFEPELVVLFLGSSAYYDLHIHSYTLRREGLVELLVRFWPGLLMSGSAIICALLYCPPHFILCLSLCMLLAIAYSVPVINGYGKQRRIREWPVVKIMVVGFAYAVMTVLVPGLDSSIPADMKTLLLLFIQRMVFIACLCIPFEVRDRNKEHIRGVRSLMDFGVKNIRVGGLSLLLLGFCSVFWLFRNGLISKPVMLSELVLSSFTAFWIVAAREDWPDWVYTYLVDGTMLLSPFLIILFMQWQ